jgi:hypothetical protein
MAERFGTFISGTIDGVVRLVVVPVTGLIPRLASSGILLAVFAALWLVFGGMLVADPAALDAAQRSLGQLPLPVLALAWLLFMPLMAGLWVWGTDWPLVLRLVVIGGIAAWNLLVFLPARERPSEAAPAAPRGA